MPRKTGVDKARGGVGQKAQSAKGRFTFQTARQVIRKGELLQGGSKYKLTRVQHERFTLMNFDLSGQIRHVTLRIAVGVLRVIKTPEVLADANIHARRLDKLRLKRLNAQASSFNGSADILVG